jgi:hypothetical protein
MANNGKCDNADGSGCNADNTGAKMVGLGYYHTLSKQTQAYIMGTYIKNDSLQSYLPAGGGDASGTGLPVNLGVNIWGATIGLKHSLIDTISFQRLPSSGRHYGARLFSWSNDSVQRFDQAALRFNCWS